jgi:hypothetical protein
MPNLVTRHIETLFLTPAAADYLDTGSFGVVITSNWSEVYTGSTAYIDSATFRAVVSPSGADILGAIEAATIKATVTPSWSEVPPATGNADAAVIYVDVDLIITYEAKGHEWVDSWSVYVNVDMDLHECFNHPTPNWVVVDFKRWEVAEQLPRWMVGEAGKHWEVFEVVGAFDNTC